MTNLFSSGSSLTCCENETLSVISPFKIPSNGCELPLVSSAETVSCALPGERSVIMRGFPILTGPVVVI